MKRAVITVVGKDCVGIIAKTCTYLADNNINILDISQTILQEFFNMVMIVDLKSCEKDFLVIAEELEKLGETMGLVIRIQREDIFDMMHRI
ncbi:MAG: ACT domain-containing protein [Lachnospiraceae bacterium]|nr:ACT domain-containing protein [Lachnospiraceae bacterium]